MHKSILLPCISIYRLFLFRTVIKILQKGEHMRRRESRWWSRMMLSSPTPTNKSKYIYMCSSTQWKQTGDWQKDVHNQGCKERSTEFGRKGEVIRSGPMSLVGIQKRRGYHRFRDPPWGFWGLNHILGTPVLGTNNGKMNPTSWFENQWDIPASCRKLRLCSWRAHTRLLTPRNKVEETN